MSSEVTTDLSVTATSAGEGLAVAPLERFGRYLIVDEIGSGAMGVVFKAYDPELDRKIAIKLMRRDAFSGESGGSARLIREAHAMARVSHPNVVSIHDVGVSNGQMFVAMEYVDGRTLRQWLNESKPTPREIVSRYLEAGRGLAAAHRAGLLHRDFKPENVLIDRDGRAKVTDFGLARLADDASSLSASAMELRGQVSAAESPLEEPLTRAGAVMGTPAYMAAEQFLGQAPDVRTEVFNFCAALWESLYGERPYAGETVAELADAVTLGNLRRAPPAPKVPIHVRRALEQGLSRDRSQRFESMDSLLAALSIDPWRRRAPTIALVVATFVVAGGALAARFIRVDPCEGAAAKASAVWSDAQLSGVQTAFLATGHPSAATTFGLVDKSLAGYVADLARARREVCEATHLRGEQSERSLDLRMRCLDRRQVEVTALIQLFGHRPDVQLLEQAVPATSQLTPLAVCGDAQVLESVVPPPENPTVRAQVDSLRGVIAVAKAEDDSGRYKTAVEMLSRVRPEVEATGYAPLRAERLFRLGLAQERSGDHGAAEATYRAAAKLAAEANDDLLAAQIWTELVLVVGALAGKTDEGLAFAAAAEAALIRARAPAALHAQLAFNLGNLYSVRSDDRRVASNQEALRLRQEAFGPSHPAVAEGLGALGQRYWESGRLDEAEVMLQKAIAMWAKELGPDHPQLIRGRTSLGSLYYLKQDFGRALEVYEGARADALRALGEDHRFTLLLGANLGNLLGDLGRAQEARTMLEDTFARLEQQNHRSYAAQTAMSLAHLNSSGKRWDDAVRWAERTIEIYEVMGNQRGQADALAHLADYELARRNVDVALAAARRSVEILERLKVGPAELSNPRFQLGRALNDSRRDPASGRRLVELAREDANGDSLARIDVWLREHR